MPLFRIVFYSPIVAAALLGLTGCGGGGGGSQTPFTPAPVATPAPTPAPEPEPTPAPTEFDTAEYNRQPSLAQISALDAYEAGATGNNIVVTVIDSGIDLDNPEFENRLHPQSADLVIASVVGTDNARDGGPNLQDSDDHGTPVAGIVAANKDDSGIHGVAPFATLLIYRADDDGEEDILYGSAIREGVNRSANLGVDVINMSFGSDEDGARGDFRQYLTTAKNADIVTVLAAGNDSDANPDLSALGALDVPGAPAAIVAGSVDRFNNISSFSDRAGDAAEIYLVAPGELIRGVTIEGTPGSTRAFSGTSAATPHIAGAAALLRSLWPNLSATEVVDILLTSATDLGLPGTDAIYGRGLLNLEAAVQPIGGASTSSVDGTSVDADDIGGELSDAFGTSFAGLSEIIVFDAYNRDFRTPLGGTIRQSLPTAFNVENSFSPFNDHRFASRRLNDRVSMHLQMSARDRSARSFMNNQIAFAHDRGSKNGLIEETLSVATIANVTDTLSFFVAQGFSGKAADEMTLSTRQTPFLSRAAFTDSFLPKSDSALTSQMRLALSKRLSLDITTSVGDDALYEATDEFFDIDPTETTPTITVARAGLSYSSPKATLRIEQGLRFEEGAVLGADFTGNNEATTIYSAIDGRWRMSPLWQLHGRVSVGLTKSDATLFDQFTNDQLSLVTTQASFAISRDKVFGANDILWIGISQPMQVEAGGVDLLLPTAFDQASQVLTFTPTRASLAADSRRLDFEASYRLLSSEFGAIDLNLIHQTFGAFDLPDQTTALVRSKFSF
ncbi:S8 family peptidase [Hyphococcus sp. DH-69]|uniref:S8 family peptidase n=1 Tax=Hyphococcus formosus TaxID=3143534 RepID=UPI00398B8F89